MKQVPCLLFFLFEIINMNSFKRRQRVCQFLWPYEAGVWLPGFSPLEHVPWTCVM